MSVNSDYFDHLYSADPDPWKVCSRWYEQRKRALLMAMLPRRRYGLVFEPACGTGDLTLCLAGRSTNVLACDYSIKAVALAQAKLSQCGNVHLEQRAIPQEWPGDSAGTFDLIVVSELAYYLTGPELALLASRCENSLAIGGEVLACHWRQAFHDRLQSTESAHAAFHAQASFSRVIQYLENDFVLEVWRKHAVGAQTRSAA